MSGFSGNNLSENIPVVPVKKRNLTIMLFFRVIIIILVLFAGTVPVCAQDQDPKFIALFITNFAKYVEWPALSDTGDFVITVISDKLVYGELKIMAEKTSVGTMRLKIQSCSKVEDVQKSRIVYIGTAHSDLLQKVIDKCCIENTLVVTNKTGLGSAGASINLLNTYWKQRYEINLKNFKQCGLNAKPVLFKLGVTIGL